MTITLSPPPDAGLNAEYKEELQPTDVGIVLEPHNSQASIPSARRRAPIFAYLVAGVASVGGILFGYDTGSVGGTFVMESFRVHLGWSWPIPDEESSTVLEQQGWINACFTLGALVGAVPAGSIADAAGRRATIAAFALLMTLAASVEATSIGIVMMYMGRFLGGVAVGAITTIVPVYIGECSPEHCRGELSTLFQLALTLGILFGSALNIPLSGWEHGWRVSYGGNIFFSLILAVAMAAFMPESPRWLVAQGKDDAASSVLARLRCTGAVDAELSEIQEKVIQERIEGSGQWRDLLRSGGVGDSSYHPSIKLRHRAVLGAALQCLQQLSGINAILFFGPAMFSRFFGPAAALHASLAISVVTHLSTYITLVAVDRYGRVPLMIVSGLGMAAAHCAVALLANATPSKVVGILIISFACVFVVFFAFGWGPVVWTLCSEIFPLRLRGKATSVTTAANWATAVVVGKLFPLLSAPTALDISGTFILFAALCLAGTVLVYFAQPETANASLEDIDEVFATHKPVLARRFWQEARRNKTTKFRTLEAGNCIRSMDNS